MDAINFQSTLTDEEKAFQQKVKAILPSHNSSKRICRIKAPLVSLFTADGKASLGLLRAIHQRHAALRLEPIHLFRILLGAEPSGDIPLSLKVRRSRIVDTLPSNVVLRFSSGLLCTDGGRSAVRGAGV